NSRSNAGFQNRTRRRASALATAMGSVRTKRSILCRRREESDQPAMARGWGVPLYTEDCRQRSGSPVDADSVGKHCGQIQGCARMSRQVNGPNYGRVKMFEAILVERYDRGRHGVRPRSFTDDRSAAPAAPETAAATPEATTTAASEAAAAAGSIASRADAARATEVARALRAVDARAAIGVQLAERVARDARRRGAVTRLRARGADRLGVGPRAVLELLPRAALAAVHVAIASGVDVAAARAADRAVALRAAARQRFAAAAPLRDAAGGAGRVSRHP